MHCVTTAAVDKPLTLKSSTQIDLKVDGEQFGGFLVEKDTDFERAAMSL